MELHITNKQFSISTLEDVLNHQVPGKYNIHWHVGKTIYDIKIYWNGKYWTDLYPRTQNSE